MPFRSAAFEVLAEVSDILDGMGQAPAEETAARIEALRESEGVAQRPWVLPQVDSARDSARIAGQENAERVFLEEMQRLFEGQTLDTN